MPRVRVAAILVQEDNILLALHEKAGRRYFVLPGGGVEYGETLEGALIREMREECSLEIRVGKLVFVHDSLPPDKHRHIVNMYFTADITGGNLQVGQGDKRLREVQFVPLSELPRVELYPAIGAQLLLGIRNGFADIPRYLGNLWAEQV